MTLPQGSYTAFVGPSGSGKSTIANLMCRYYDADSGEVLIDGKNVKDYNLQELRRNVGITMQEAFLFSDTVEGNIAFAKTDASFEDVEINEEEKTMIKLQVFTNWNLDKNMLLFIC